MDLQTTLILAGFGFTALSFAWAYGLVERLSRFVIEELRLVRGKVDDVWLEVYNHHNTRLTELEKKMERLNANAD